jgi:hypothetical protein
LQQLSPFQLENRTLFNTFTVHMACLAKCLWLNLAPFLLGLLLQLIGEGERQQASPGLQEDRRWKGELDTSEIPILARLLNLVEHL